MGRGIARTAVGIAIVIAACGSDDAETTVDDTVPAGESPATVSPDATITAVPTAETDPPPSPDTDEPASETSGPSGDVDSGEVDDGLLDGLDGFIVFSSERDDGPDDSSDDLYQMRADGSEVVRLTDSDRNEWWPHVSSDGSTLVFGRDYPDETRAVASGHAAWGVWIWGPSDEPVDLTDNAQFQSGARLSPDGTRLLLTSGQGSRAAFVDGLYELGDTNVWVTDPDGSNAVQLTDGGGSAGSWSPDGAQVVFSARVEDREDSDIFVADADGADVRQLTDDLANDTRPDWSPDGQRIVFDSDRDGDSEIHVMAVDGSGAVALTDNDVDDDFARWSPDGEAIAFVSRRDGNAEIYVMRADGSGQTNLTDDPALDLFPSWSNEPFRRPS